MTKTVSIAPVRKSISVPLSQDATFALFTEGMIRWWPTSHSINATPFAEIIIEPRSGGRWYEKGADGSECDWGRVLAWEPPARLLLSWQITPQWQFDPDLMTEIEVRLTPEASRTRLDLEHRLEGYGEAAPAMFDLFNGPNAWGGMLETFGRVAEQ